MPIRFVKDIRSKDGKTRVKSGKEVPQEEVLSAVFKEERTKPVMGGGETFKLVA